MAYPFAADPRPTVLIGGRGREFAPARPHSPVPKQELRGGTFVLARTGTRDAQGNVRSGLFDLPEIQSRPDLYGALAELERLIGLGELKTFVFELVAFVLVSERRRQMGLRVQPQSYHMVFSGSPGTGKTTAARLLGRVFAALGLLPRGHVVEVERADLVGEYIGHTAQRTRDAIQRAMGGILFIDEAYSLARGGERDFGREAIDTLVKAMEDHRERFLLILAGYEREMEEFLATNPGLPSRFPFRLRFPDYTVEELLAIADLFVEERDYRLAPGARAALERLIVREKRKFYPPFSNARFVRNVVEGAIRAHAARVLREGRMSPQDLTLLTVRDVEAWEGGFAGEGTNERGLRW
ncbi:AAA family ATPase [Brockia lithotrophica]|uniref:Stage V sporulation protein K n=1 Tax=Brockia lithotrophica TaxID=933949 RepID=A0A660L3V3_9BACL|nr:AAA family ATPase [Brockia lithotrophica]RKQ88691.1 stage V sporulation protein K [Brockia lithotrophica]